MADFPKRNAGTKRFNFEARIAERGRLFCKGRREIEGVFSAGWKEWMGMGG